MVVVVVVVGIGIAGMEQRRLGMLAEPWFVEWQRIAKRDRRRVAKRLGIVRHVAQRLVDSRPLRRWFE
jgi:hypothetical protein